MAAKQRSAARDFPDERSFSMALVVLNKRGERRRGVRTAQARWVAVGLGSSPAGGEGELPLPPLLSLLGAAGLRSSSRLIAPASVMHLVDAQHVGTHH